MSFVSWQNALSFCLILAVLLAMFALATPALADTPLAALPILDDFERSTLLAGGLYIGSVGDYHYYAGTRIDSVYVGNIGGIVYLVSLNTDLGVIFSDLYRNSTAGLALSQVSMTESEDGSYYYFSRRISGFSFASNIPTYDSLASFVLAIQSYVPPTLPSEFSYTLPPGNVAYIPIASGQSSAIAYTLTTTYYMAFGNNDTSRINQVVTVMSTLPSTSNNLAPTSPKIPWTNNGNVNLLGVSANKIYQGSIPANYGGQYLVVVNPLTMPSHSGSIGGDTYTNGSINITVSAVSGSPHIYPMSESLTISPGDGIGSESSYGDSAFTYEVDPETGEVIWSDPYGGSSAPVAGGNNPMPSPSTIFDWLRNISLQIADFLRGPVQAVQVVVSAIRDFMGSFTLLYQWLPGPVYSLITSALMVALTIGVIKIFV